MSIVNQLQCPLVSLEMDSVDSTQAADSSSHYFAVLIIRVMNSVMYCVVPHRAHRIFCKGHFWWTSFVCFCLSRPHFITISTHFVSHKSAKPWKQSVYFWVIHSFQIFCKAGLKKMPSFFFVPMCIPNVNMWFMSHDSFCWIPFSVHHQKPSLRVTRMSPNWNSTSC